MDKLNFASYAKSVEKGMPDPTMIGITKLLMGFIVDQEGVLNSNGNPYTLSNYNTNRWWNQHDNIPGPIKKAAASTHTMSISTAYFESNIITELSPQKEIHTYSSLNELIKNDSSIDNLIKDELLDYYNDGELTDFLARTFLYALQRENKDLESVNKNKSAFLMEDINELTKLLQRFPKPIVLLPPEDLNKKEMVYISELLAAYNEHEGISTIDKDNIESYPKLKKNYDRQRKDYYAAETIRQDSRDTLSFFETDQFKVLKEETLDGIIDVCEDEYPDGFNRLNNVMKHATTIQLNKSLICRLPGWISNSEKKGICHILVNDGEIKWVNDDE